MKITKSTAIILATVMLILGAFTACSKETENVKLDEYTTLPTTEATSEVGTIAIDDSTVETSTDMTTDVTETATETEAVSDADTTINIIIPETVATETVATTEATQPATQAPVSENSCGTIASSIAARTDLFSEEMFEGSANRASTLFKLSDGDYSDIAYYTASAAVAEEILVVKASSESKVSTIVNGMNSRKEAQIEDYASYVPEEVPKLNSATVFTDGLYVVYCVCADSNTAGELIRSLF